MAKAAAAKEVVVVVVVMNLFVLQQGCPSSRPTATSDGRRGRGGTRGQSQGNAAFLSSFHVKLVSLTFYRFRLLLQRANKKPQERSKRPPRSFPNHPPLSNSVTCRLAVEPPHLSLTTSPPTYASSYFLQTLNSISAEKNSTIIFPLPIDLISSFLGNGSMGSKND